MSDPPLSDIDFKFKIAWVRTTLNFTELTNIKTTKNQLMRMFVLKNLYEIVKNQVIKFNVTKS